MELISHDQFGRLRLADFAPDGTKVIELEDWEYLNRLWIGEAIGFTEWLRDVERPDVLGALSLALSTLPDETSQRVLAVLHLPLSRGMSYRQVVEVMGEPTRSHQYVSNQTTFDFQCGNEWQYEVGCTIRDKEGLIHITVVAG
jgi:hypothetical protein